MRLEELRDRMTEDGVGALAVTKEANAQYLFDVGVGGLFLVTQSSVESLVSGFHRYEFEDSELDPRFYSDRSDAQQKAEELLEDREVVHADSESRLLNTVEMEEISLVERMRRRKSDEEVESIREACDTTAEAISRVSQNLFSGGTELELRAQLNQFYAEKGVDEAFLDDGGMSLVQSSGMRPHRPPADVVPGSGEMVIVDSGCVVDGYRSDITRTFCQEPSEEQRQLFEDVLEIQSELAEMAEPGVDALEIHRRLLTEAEERGYDPDRHVLYPPGHGVGVRIHEAPSLSVGSESELKAGDVITLEPGLHVPGVGGCRIEDVYRVGGGVQRLSDLDRRLKPKR
jgi:Xaa-Pro aminopeptidase